jgi:hypothetical protein
VTHNPKCPKNDIVARMIKLHILSMLKLNELQKKIFQLFNQIPINKMAITIHDYVYCWYHNMNGRYAKIQIIKEYFDVLGL